MGKVDIQEHKPHGVCESCGNRVRGKALNLLNPLPKPLTDLEHLTRTLDADLQFPHCIHKMASENIADMYTYVARSLSVLYEDGFAKKVMCPLFIPNKLERYGGIMCSYSTPLNHKNYITNLPCIRAGQEQQI